MLELPRIKGPQNSEGEHIIQVLHRLSSMVHIELESSCLNWFPLLTISRVEITPSLHFSLSDIFCAGKAAQILAEPKASDWFRPVFLLSMPENRVRLKRTRSRGKTNTLMTCLYHRANNVYTLLIPFNVVLLTFTISILTLKTARKRQFLSFLIK